MRSEDVLAIQQLASAYCHHIDGGDGEAWADLFTPDGVFDIVDMIAAEGREALVQNALMFPQFLPGGRHVVQNVFVEPDAAGDADKATMRCYLQFVVVGDEPKIVQTGRYVDDVVRTDDGWRFARRTLTLDGPLF